MRRICPFALMVCTLATSGVVFAAGEAKEGIRTPLSFAKRPACTSAQSSVREIQEAYYAKSSQDFLELLAPLLVTCGVVDRSQEGSGAYVVVFAARRAASADPEIVHILLRIDGEQVQEVGGFPGVESVTWAYLTDDATDVPRGQMFSKVLQNPLAGKVGPLVEKVVTNLPGTMTRRSIGAVAPENLAGELEGDAGKRPAKTVTVWTVPTTLPARRASVGADVYLQRTVDGEKKPEQKEYAGEVTFANTPRSWVTLHAGFGVLTGKLRGASPAKIDEKEYVDDPLKRAATFVGGAFHLPFDSSSPVPTPAERVGLVTAALLTPAAGLYVGPSYGWRGFSLTAGVALLWVQTTPAGVAVGDAVKKPADGGPEKELVYKRSHALMIGGTYVFGS